MDRRCSPDGSAALVRGYAALGTRVHKWGAVPGQTGMPGTPGQGAGCRPGLTASTERWRSLLPACCPIRAIPLARAKVCSRAWPATHGALAGSSGLRCVLSQRVGRTRAKDRTRSGRRGKPTTFPCPLRGADGAHPCPTRAKGDAYRSSERAARWETPFPRSVSCSGAARARGRPTLLGTGSGASAGRRRR